MTLGDLTPYQKQNSYYKGIQLGKDVSKQAEIINTSTRALIATQMASTSAIIASQERVNDGIDNIACGIERVDQGIYGLQAAFEWGISEVVWQLEQNREMLKSILEVLQAPLDTKARERRKRAERAYTNNLIPEAEEEFLESETLNKFDFTIHISLGMIYLFHNAEKDKALEYFEKAIRYAKPESSYHASYALLYKALILYDNGQVVDAEKYTEEAIELSPDFAEALYQNAQYNALLNNHSKAIPLLKKVIGMDINYCLKIEKEKDFDGIRPSIIKMFEELRDIEIARATNEVEYQKKILASATDMIIQIDKVLENNQFSSNNNIAALRDNISIAEKSINNNSIYDALNANIRLAQTKKNTHIFLDKLKQTFQSLIDTAVRNKESLERSIEANKTAKKELYKNVPGMLFAAIVWFFTFGALGGLIVGLIVGGLIAVTIGLTAGVIIGLTAGILTDLFVSYRFFSNDVFDYTIKIRPLPEDIHSQINRNIVNFERLVEIKDKYRSLF